MVDRYDRQKALVPAERLALRSATVIGVGAVGRQVALQLAAIGIRHLQLIDFDKVEETNIASQGYCEADLDVGKVFATSWDCREINSKIDLVPEFCKFSPDMDYGETIFCCVDSIDTRKEIFDAVGHIVSFFVDGRMAAESMRVITVHDNASLEYYPTTLFTEAEAYQDSCTAKTTIYCANIIAGIMVGHFVKTLRGVPVEKDISFNLLANEFTVLKE